MVWKHSDLYIFMFYVLDCESLSLRNALLSSLTHAHKRSEGASGLCNDMEQSYVVDEKRRKRETTVIVL